MPTHTADIITDAEIPLQHDIDLILLPQPQLFNPSRERWDFRAVAL